MSPPPALSSTPPAEAGPGLAARRAALDILDGALQHRRGLDEALTAPGLSSLEPRDRAFARVLAMTVLRRRGALDVILWSRLQRPPPDAVIELLRLGAAQLLYLDTPVHAAVSTAVDLAAERPATRPFRALVNAVLRGLLRDAPQPSPPEALAPDWLYARWRAAWGEADARAITAMIADEPATDLTLRDASLAVELAPALEAQVLPGGSLRAGLRGDLAGWPGYAEGRWWVQDASAAIPARLLAIQPGETVLDVCAAPGGKTLQLAAARARVTAIDRSGPRLERLKENLARTGLAADVVVADAAKWSDPRQFDAVLLDAPCTSTGTFRRHPDVLWAVRPGDIAKLAALQASLLTAAADRVRPGGRLVYCVCSLEPEEGEAQVETFLRGRSDFRRDPIAPGEGGAPQPSVTPGGLLRILPHHLPGGTDGFFAARLVRLPGLGSEAKSSP